MRAPYVAIRVEATGRRAGAADIVASVVREIASGALPPGSRLPPVRVLEHQLGISKNTVQAAYDELMARGVVEPREREGVFVTGVPAAVAPLAPPALAPPLPAVVPAPPIRAADRTDGAVALSNVFIDRDLLPTEKLAECARAVLREPGLAAPYEPQGHPQLRRLIAERLGRRGLDVDPDEVVITTGSQQSLDIVARALAARRIAIETPVYPYARLLFESLGVDLVPLPLDPFTGIDLATWERALAARRPALVYAISSFHNPTGYSYTTSELVGVLELCARYGAALLEDDWGSDMLSGSEYRPMLRALGGRTVLYVNSFTKKLLPSLRVGFVVADRSVVPTLVAMKRLSTLGNAWLTEAVVAEFLARGYYDGHLAALQRELDARYQACLVALDELMPAGVRWTRPGGGPTLWLEVPRAVDLARLERDLAARGISIHDTRSAFLGEPHLHGFRIGFAYLPAEQLRAGLVEVAALLRAAL
jgi:DNA-binding transcriptional MocR family regulator